MDNLKNRRRYFLMPHTTLRFTQKMQKVIILSPFKDRLYRIWSLFLRGSHWSPSYCVLALISSESSFPYRRNSYVGRKWSPLTPYNVPTYSQQTGAFSPEQSLALYSFALAQSAGNAVPPPSRSGTPKSDPTSLLPLNANSCNQLHNTF